jgi:hypothetical protein
MTAWGGPRNWPTTSSLRSFPFFSWLITLLGYLPVPNLLDRLMDMLAQMLPGDALSLVQDWGY